MKLIFVCAIFLVVQIVYSCKHEGKTYTNGQEWIERDAFVMKCNVQDNGAWSTKVIACLTPDKKRIAVDGTLNEGKNQWKCKTNDRGMISLVQGANPHAKCEGHSVGERWIERSFELECTPGGVRKLINCVAENGQKVPVNGSKEVFGKKRTCTQHSNGTVVYQ